MEWQDIQNLFQRAKLESQHAWVDVDDDDDDGDSENDSKSSDNSREFDDDLQSEEILDEKERALLKALKYMREKQPNEVHPPPSLGEEAAKRLKPLPKSSHDEQSSSYGPAAAAAVKEHITKDAKKDSSKQRGESFYSKTQDDKDAAWLRAHYLKHKMTPDGKQTGRPSDATLSCPCCFTVVCYDCQRHETYRNQFRAMFVANCRVIEDKALEAELGKSSIKSVVCDHCNASVGVVDEDEVYHFVNAFPGEPI